MTTTALMAGKRGLVMGVANDHSIAWGIARALAAAGAELAFTYQNDTFAKRLRPLAEGIGAKIVLPCDVERDADLPRLFAELGERWSGLDFIVHSLAYSDKEELGGHYVETSRDNFLRTMNISCYSLTAVARHARPLMAGAGGAMITLT